jgi:hypothetical protein
LKRVLRLSLSDFIDTDIEEDVIYMLEKIKEGLFFDFSVWMWYYDKRVPECSLTKFKTTYHTQLQKLEIDVRHINGYEDFVWYDVISIKDMCLLKKYKFRLTYDIYLQIPNCLLEFNSFAKSYNNRNGHRNVTKNCLSGVAKVG